MSDVPAELKGAVASSPELRAATISLAPEFSPTSIYTVVTPFESVEAVPVSLPKIANPSG
jgi:hypothetical protein